MSAPAESSRSASLVRFGVFEFDPETGDLWKAGHHIRLPDQPRQALGLLVSRPGSLVSREELRRTLWPDETFVDFETGLNVIINRLRQALDDSASTPRFIETLARRGYRFIAPIAAPATPSGATASDHSRAVTVDEQQSTAARRLRIGRTIGIVVVVFAAVSTMAAVIAWIVRRDTVGIPAIRSIAVLPLRDVSRDPREAWFAEGMTDAVISDLGRISALRIISRQSTKTFQHSPDSMRDISRRLGADAVIEGSAALGNDRVRVTVRLVHGATDRQLWTGTYERALSDVLTLQGELAQAIADSVRVIVTGDEQKALASRRAVDPDAYLSSLRAGHFFNLRGPDNVTKSIQYYKQAIAEDPTFAAAYGGMALSYCLLDDLAPSEDAYRPVKEAAAQALALDPTQPDALLAMTQAAMYGDRDWRTAQRGLVSLLERYPNHATAHMWYASLLTEIGPLDRALAERRRALALDPLGNAANNSLGSVLLQMGRHAEAVTAFRNVLALDPNYADARCWLGIAYVRMRRSDDGIAELEQCVRISHEHPRMVARLAHAYGLVSRHADGQRLLMTLVDRSRTESIAPTFLAHASAGLGDVDRAFAYLDQAYNEGTPGLMRMKSDPLLDPLEADPRFADLVRRMGLPWP